MAEMRHCDNKKCKFTEEKRGRPTVKTYKLIMQCDTDNSDVLYAHSVDLCAKCVKAVRSAMKKTLNIDWTEYTKGDVKALNGGGKSKSPAAVAPVENVTGIGSEYDYLQEKNKSKKPKENQDDESI